MTSTDVRPHALCSSVLSSWAIGSSRVVPGETSGLTITMSFLSGAVTSLHHPASHCRRVGTSGFRSEPDQKSPQVHRSPHVYMYTSSRAAPASSTMNNALLLRRPSLLASDSTRPGRHCARGGASFVPRASLPDHHISGSMERVGTVRARAFGVVILNS